MQEDNIDLQQEAKDLVLNELEKNGVINFMRANIKKSILDIINHEKENVKQKLDFDFMTPLHRLNKSKEIILVCQLIKEFLKFYEMEYTLPIFENESNVKENIKRDTLLKELKLQGKKEDSKPVLLILLMDKLNSKDNVAAGLNANKGASDRYDFNNFGSVFNRDDSSAVVPNKKLSPISFGTTNKSLDMNNNSAEPDKFNTFNISDVYKRDKPDPAKETSENKGKDITSADILSGGDKSEKKLSDELKKENNEIKPPTNPVNDANKNSLVDDFKEVILEDIDNNPKISQEKKDGESQSFSTSNMNSLGGDSSVGPKNNNNFDYVEEVDKKI